MRIVAITSDLMDRSKIGAALGDVEFARDASGCAFGAPAASMRAWAMAAIWNPAERAKARLS